jgi:hypothetical protein
VETLEVVMSPSVKSCICIRGLWLEVAGRDGDAQGTGESSNAILLLTAPYHLSPAAVVSSTSRHCSRSCIIDGTSGRRWHNGWSGMPQFLPQSTNVSGYRKESHHVRIMNF